MARKIRFLGIVLLFTGTLPMVAATGRPEDGLLFFLVLMSLFGVILALLQTGHWILQKADRFLKGILEGLDA